MILTITNKLWREASPDLRRRLVLIYGFLAALNVLVWIAALLASSRYPLLLGLAAVAYGFGLRHAVDPDHIAAIDNTTRKLMQDGQNPVGVGFYFSLGHSTVVFGLSVLIALSTAFVKEHLPQMQSVGAVIGTGASGLFLIGIAILNIVILSDIFRTWRRVVRGGTYDQKKLDEYLNNRGLLARLLRPLLRVVRHSWNMYPIGFLFGLGFDTASEVGILGITAATALGPHGMPVYLILLLPLLFVAGMSLADTTDGVAMLGAYGWAFVRPVRKLYYNMTITFISVVVALLIGGLEIAQVLIQETGARGGLWNALGAIQLANTGFVILGIFLACWIASVLYYRWSKIDRLEESLAGARSSPPGGQGSFSATNNPNRPLFRCSHGRADKMRRCDLIVGLSVLVAGSILFAQPAKAASGGLAGIVRDAASGAPIAVARVEIVSASRSLATQSSKDGRFSFSALAADTYAVTATRDGYRVVTLAGVGVFDGQTANVTLEMQRGLTTLGSVEVRGRRGDLVGIAASAATGVVGPKELAQRPILRPGEVLETVPGVVISQHSGGGKANQYYLRGFNLDHGTDIAISIAGVPINNRTHAHGQGYSDINFLIPELVSGLQYKKGPYAADEGDFSTSGAVNIDYANTIPSILELGVGQEGYDRLLVAASPRVGAGHLLYGFEQYHEDGPWVLPDNYRRSNGILRFSVERPTSTFSITAIGYQGEFHSSDQIAQRAVLAGQIDRFGFIDATDGGRTHRYSVSALWQRFGSNVTTNIAAYAVDYQLNLFSDFTYFLERPTTMDQFEQADKRFFTGANISNIYQGKMGALPTEDTVGVQLRNDNIAKNALYHTQARREFETVDNDHIVESSEALYLQRSVKFSNVFRGIFGLRGDLYQFKVAANVPANSGSVSASIASPKTTLIFGPFHQTEYYVNFGESFHSNDGRGTTITIDPNSVLENQRDPSKPILPADKVTPLVRARGLEVGLRSDAIRNLRTTLGLFDLRLGSELVFNGDGGNTAPSRPSQRTGVEWANFFTPNRHLTIDADASYTTAHFTDVCTDLQAAAGTCGVGNQIPGALQTVYAAGAALDSGPTGLFGSLRYRYFGPRPLIEDNSVRSNSSALVNAQLGIISASKLRYTLDIFNLFNSHASDIDYYYTSRLPGEPISGVNGIHFHPTVPRTMRFSIRWKT